MAQFGQYPNAFYRVSIKAIIRDHQGRVLVVRENQDHWSLPGGGLDHGESDRAAMTRELKEEINYKGGFEMKPMSIATIKYDHPGLESMLMWIVYDVNLENYEISAGKDADEIDFIDPVEFKNSNYYSELLIYKICVDDSLEIDGVF